MFLGATDGSVREQVFVLPLVSGILLRTAGLRYYLPAVVIPGVGGAVILPLILCCRHEYIVVLQPYKRGYMRYFLPGPKVRKKDVLEGGSGCFLMIIKHRRKIYSKKYNSFLELFD